jgi:hypothetical protein
VKFFQINRRVFRAFLQLSRQDQSGNLLSTASLFFLHFVGAKN